jgi:competence protein ComEA
MEPPAPAAGAFTVQHGQLLAGAAPPTPAPPTPPAATVLTTSWPHRVQWATALLLVLAAALLIVHAVAVQPGGSRPSSLQRGDTLKYRVDLNKARRAELLQLPGIGPTLAERIEQYRNEHGGFGSVEELTKVRGIGPATLQRLRPFVCVNAGEFEDEGDDPDDARAVQRTSAYTPNAKGKASAKDRAAQLKGPVDINRATQAELRQLPGIGPVLSQRIIEVRAQKPFSKVDDLRRVSGIGPKTLEKLRPLVTVGE